MVGGWFSTLLGSDSTGIQTVVKNKRNFKRTFSINFTYESKEDA